MNAALEADAEKLRAEGQDPGPALEDYDFDDQAECWNCGGEGVIYSCFEEYACIDPEGGCDECERRCDVCKGVGA
jgi:hypothetical protein